MYAQLGRDPKFHKLLSNQYEACWITFRRILYCTELSSSYPAVKKMIPKNLLEINFKNQNKVHKILKNLSGSEKGGERAPKLRNWFFSLSKNPILLGIFWESFPRINFFFRNCFGNFSSDSFLYGLLHKFVHRFLSFRDFFICFFFQKFP